MAIPKRPMQTSEIIQRHLVEKLNFKPPFDERFPDANTVFKPVKCLNGDGPAYVTHDLIIRNPGNIGEELKNLQSKLRELAKNSKIIVTKPDGANGTRYVIRHPDD
ncbi:MAG: hypothetical protein WCX64_05785 [Candidatus Micrarchaeia archaeon]